MSKAIRLKEDIVGYMCTFETGEIFFENLPDQGFEEKNKKNKSFIICQGMGIYIEVKYNQYEIVTSIDAVAETKRILMKNLVTNEKDEYMCPSCGEMWDIEEMCNEDGCCNICQSIN